MGKLLMFSKISNSCDSCDTLETYSSAPLSEKANNSHITRDTLQMLFMILQPDSHIWWRPSVRSHFILQWAVQQMENYQRLNCRDTSFLFIVTSDASSFFQFIGRIIALCCGLHTREHVFVYLYSVCAATPISQHSCPQERMNYICICTLDLAKGCSFSS